MKFLFLLLFLPFASFCQETPRDMVIDGPELEPEYPGGRNAMNMFLVNHVSYPEEARKKGEQGVVYVRFFISEMGELSNITVLRGVSPLLDAEAVRVVSIMPNWIPPMKDGKPVSVYFTLPIHFRLG